MYEASSAADPGAPLIDVQGHRGARGLAPENTLAGVARALEIGVSTLELDLLVTRDWVVVAGHDPILNGDIVRGPDGSWLPGEGPAVHALTFRELSLYDVGRLRPESDYAAQFLYQVSKDGERMPRLADVFALAGGTSHQVRFNLEIKSEPGRPELCPPPATFAERVVELVREAGLAARTTLQSFDWRCLRRVQEIAPEIPTSYLTERATLGLPAPNPWLAGFDLERFAGSVPAAIAAAGGRGWSPEYQDLKASNLADARDHGLGVLVWTVNRPRDMEAMIKLGVDGVITDRPDLLRLVLAARGLPVPEPTPVGPWTASA